MNNGESGQAFNEDLYQAFNLQSMPRLKQVMISPKQTIGGAGSLRFKQAGLHSTRSIRQKPRWKSPLLNGNSLAAIHQRNGSLAHQYSQSPGASGAMQNVQINHVNSVQYLQHPLNEDVHHSQQIQGSQALIGGSAVSLNPS